MPRIQPIQPEQATGRAKELLDTAQKKMGRTPNMIKTLAHSPAALEAYLSFSAALHHATLPLKLREQIALLAAELNHCDYCLAAHTAIGKLAGLTETELTASRGGDATDARTRAALAFTRKLMTERGHVSDADVALVRQVGFSDGEILEIVAAIALNIYTNYVNDVVQATIDFPAVPALNPR